MRHFPELEGVRGLLALWVVLGHWSATVWSSPPFDPRLHVGTAVELFMLLSGLVIARLLFDGREQWPRFILRRILRIFPTYLLFLVIAALVAPAMPGVWQAAPDTPLNHVRLAIATDSLADLRTHLAAHMLLLHGLVPTDQLPSTDFALVGQAWSLSLEWQFYLLAPALVGALRPPFSPFRIVLPLGLWLASLVAMAVWPMPFGFLGRHLHLFLLGIASAALLAAIDRNASLARRCRPALAAAACLCATIAATEHAALLAPALWCALLWSILRTGPAMPRVAALLSSPPLARLGQVAFPLYLSHMLVLATLLKTVARLDLGPALATPAGAILLLLALLTLALPLSWLVHHHVEAPCHRLGRILGQGSSTQPREKSGDGPCPSNPAMASRQRSMLRNSAGR